MLSLHHKPIKKFSLSGVIRDDASIGRLRDEYARLILSEMRLSGYVPRLDIDIDFTTEYNNKTEMFNFDITMYGVFVGKKKSEWIQGIDGIRVVLATPKNKSNEFLREQESPLREK